VQRCPSLQGASHTAQRWRRGLCLTVAGPSNSQLGSNGITNMATSRGVTLHMLGALRDFGKVGFTCVGDSPREADELYAETLRLLQHWDPRRR
jgi:hypothetical protein